VAEPFPARPPCQGGIASTLPFVVYAYLAATVVGAILLVASFLGAGHDHDAAHDGAGEHASPAFALLSVRVWTYLLAFGGATGLLLRFVAHVHEPWRAMIALAVGAVAAALARVVIGRAVRGQPSGTVQSGDLVGRSAGVVVPFGAGATGKVRLRVADSDVDLLATTDDGEPLARDEEVLIVEVRDDGAALVTRAPK
jgi:membrane protein implicated in regulation of membrane protease activity